MKGITMATIRWSSHKDDAKVGQIEEVEDNAAARFVATGMARYTEKPDAPTVEIESGGETAQPADTTVPTDDDTAPSDPTGVETQSGEPDAATDPDDGTSTEALDPLASAVVDAPDESSSTPAADGDPAVETAAPKAQRRGPSAKR